MAGLERKERIESNELQERNLGERIEKIKVLVERELYDTVCDNNKYYYYL